MYVILSLKVRIVCHKVEPISVIFMCTDQQHVYTLILAGKSHYVTILHLLITIIL